MVKRLDEALGRLLDALKSLNLLENTVVRYTSDHGCHFRTRNDEYKRSCHDASIRVPTALLGPGFSGGAQVRQLTSLLDLTPTLLDAAGLPVPEEMSGRSVLPLLHGKTDGWHDEVFIQISESQVGRALRTPRWKYAVAAPDEDGERVPAADRYVETHLYDLHADPYELTNLVGLESFRGVADGLRDGLLRHVQRVERVQPTIFAAASRERG